LAPPSLRLTPVRRCALTECGNDVDLLYRERGYS
jgi:hypothetical protein